MAKKKEPKPDPVERFIFHIQAGSTYCRSILKHLEEHFGVDPEDVNWGHVGSAEYVTEKLQEICEFLGLKEV